MDEQERPERCAVLKIKRSVLIVLISFIFVTPAYGQNGFGEWFIQKKVDPIDDTVSLFAGVVKENKKQLIVSCLNEERFAVGIVWGQYISPFGISLRKNRRDQEVIVRFDKSKPERMKWVVGSKGENTFISDAWNPDQIDDFVEKLKKHKKVIVRSKGSLSGTMTIVFPLSGSTYAIEMVRHTCGLRKDKPEKKKIERKAK